MFLYFMCLIFFFTKNSLGKGSMKLTGNAGSKRVEYSMEFVLSRSKTNIAEETCPLHRLAAKSRLSEMEMNDSQGIWVPG